MLDETDYLTRVLHELRGGGVNLRRRVLLRDARAVLRLGRNQLLRFWKCVRLSRLVLVILLDPRRTVLVVGRPPDLRLQLAVIERVEARGHLGGLL